MLFILCSTIPIMKTHLTSHTWHVDGHDWAVDHLRKSMANERVRHAYLFLGPESVGKETLARAFAMALNCTHPDPSLRPCGECSSCHRIQSGNHPDVFYAQTDSNTGALKIEEIRSMTGRIALKPFEGHYRVAILPDFDHAQPRAQDALLKTLEEPPPHAILILLAPSADMILPTITSRSQILHLRPLSAQTICDVLVDKHGADIRMAGLIAHVSGGRIGWALNALHNPDALAQREQQLAALEQIIQSNRAGRFALAEDLGKDKQSLFPLLELWLTYWRDLMLLCEGSGLEPSNVDRAPAFEQLARYVSADEALAALNATQTALRTLHTNANTRLALEVMFLDYPGLMRE
jgi:DNA polymerase-3 subunit delta'